MTVQRRSTNERLTGLEMQVDSLGSAVGELQDEGFGRGASLPGAEPQKVTHVGGGSHHIPGNYYGRRTDKLDPDHVPGAVQRHPLSETETDKPVQAMSVQRDISTDVEALKKDREVQWNTISSHSDEIEELQDAARAKGHKIRPKPERRTSQAPV